MNRTGLKLLGVNRRAKHTPDVALDALLAGDLSELRMAEYFVDLHGERLKFCKSFGGWLVYDDRRWVRDDDGEVFRLVGTCVKQIADGARRLDDVRCRKLLAFAIQAQKRRVIENIIAIAQNDARVAIGDPNRFDADPQIANFKNGTLNLRTRVLNPHRPADLIAKIAAVPYEPEALCPRWRQFLQEIFRSDVDLIAFVQRAIGYSLSGDTREECLFLLYGHGANGKSTFLRMIQELLGDYRCVASTDTFLSRRPGGASNDLARLNGARFVSAVETTSGAALNEAFVKAVTGRDRLPARYLYCEYFEFMPRFKLWLAVNHKPRVRGTDLGIWRRIRLVPFERTFSGDDCDPDLDTKLRAELPGILSWAVFGYHLWQEQGLGQSAAVRVATADYRAESDVIAQFIRECCVIGPRYTVGSTPLFKAFQQWAEANGERAGTQTDFSTRLSEHGDFGKSQDSNGRIQWRGIGLLEK
jgi:putative DNA primase/helicase